MSDQVKASDWAWVDPHDEDAYRRANSAKCSHQARLDAEQRSVLPHGFREITPKGLEMRSKLNEGGTPVRMRSRSRK